MTYYDKRFTNAIPLVTHARENGYAVPAFNTNGGTYDIARAALEAAQDLHSPLILQVYEPNTEYRGMAFHVELTTSLVKDLGITIPLALHLDHGHSFGSVEQAIRSGFTSVMFDASHDPLEENIAQTRKVIQLAAGVGVSVEAEVGYVSGNEPAASKQIGCTEIPASPSFAGARTSPAEAVQFVRETHVDMLAVAVGSIHGVYQRQSALDFDLLAELRQKVEVPLVAHGTCGISNDDLSRLVFHGMAKINFGEPFRMNYIRYFRQLSEELEHRWHPWRIMREVKERLRSDMKQLILALGADGKAQHFSHPERTGVC